MFSLFRFVKSRVKEYHRFPDTLGTIIEPCQEFRGQTVLQIEAVHNLRKVRMYLNVLSLRSTS